MPRTTAIVTANVFIKGAASFEPIATAKTSMTQDLPAANLGEIVAEVVEKAWKAGHDPVNFQVVIGFS